MQGLVGHNDNCMAYQDLIFVLKRSFNDFMKNKLEMGKNRSKETIEGLWHYSRGDMVDSSRILELELIDGLGEVKKRGQSDESLCVAFNTQKKIIGFGEGKDQEL